MHNLAVIGIALVVTFLAELPDKSMFASLVMATRYRPAWVWPAQPPPSQCTWRSR